MRFRVIAVFVAGAFCAGSAYAEPGLPEAVVKAGAAAVAEQLKGGTTDPEKVAIAAYDAMGGGWHPIASAPQDGSDILLGRWNGDVFVQGIGRWLVNDEADMPGYWTVTDWFGAKPTYWLPIPTPPPAR